MKRRKPYIKPRTDIIQMETDAVLIDPSLVFYDDGSDAIPIIPGNPDPKDNPFDPDIWDPEQTAKEELLYTWPSQKSLWED